MSPSYGRDDSRHRLDAPGRWGDLDDLLDRIASDHPHEYAQYSRAYLNARALTETLSQELSEDDYAVAASYNTGPKETALWLRMSPATGDDYFLTTINSTRQSNTCAKDEQLQT